MMPRKSDFLPLPLVEIDECWQSTPGRNVAKVCLGSKVSFVANGTSSVPPIRCICKFSRALGFVSGEVDEVKLPEDAVSWLMVAFATGNGEPTRFVIVKFNRGFGLVGVDEAPPSDLAGGDEAVGLVMVRLGLVFASGADAGEAGPPTRVIVKFNRGFCRGDIRALPEPSLSSIDMLDEDGLALE